MPEQHAKTGQWGKLGTLFVIVMSIGFFFLVSYGVQPPQPQSDIDEEASPVASGPKLAESNDVTASIEPSTALPESLAEKKQQQPAEIAMNVPATQPDNTTLGGSADIRFVERRMLGHADDYVTGEDCAHTLNLTQVPFLGARHHQQQHQHQQEKPHGSSSVCLVTVDSSLSPSLHQVVDAMYSSCNLSSAEGVVGALFAFEAHETRKVHEGAKTAQRTAVTARVVALPQASPSQSQPSNEKWSVDGILQLLTQLVDVKTATTTISRLYAGERWFKTAPEGAAGTCLTTKNLGQLSFHHLHTQLPFMGGNTIVLSRDVADYVHFLVCRRGLLAVPPGEQQQDEQGEVKRCSTNSSYVSKHAQRWQKEHGFSIQQLFGLLLGGRDIHYVAFRDLEMQLQASTTKETAGGGQDVETSISTSSVLSSSVIEAPSFTTDPAIVNENPPVAEELMRVFHDKEKKRNLTSTSLRASMAFAHSKGSVAAEYPYNLFDPSLFGGANDDAKGGKTRVSGFSRYVATRETKKKNTEEATATCEGKVVVSQLSVPEVKAKSKKERVLAVAYVPVPFHKEPNRAFARCHHRSATQAVRSAIPLYFLIGARRSEFPSFFHYQPPAPSSSSSSSTSSSSKPAIFYPEALRLFIRENVTYRDMLLFDVNDMDQDNGPSGSLLKVLFGILHAEVYYDYDFYIRGADDSYMNTVEMHLAFSSMLKKWEEAKKTNAESSGKAKGGDEGEDEQQGRRYAHMQQYLGLPIERGMKLHKVKRHADSRYVPPHRNEALTPVMTASYCAGGGFVLSRDVSYFLLESHAAVPMIAWMEEDTNFGLGLAPLVAPTFTRSVHDFFNATPRPNKAYNGWLPRNYVFCRPEDWIVHKFPWHGLSRVEAETNRMFCTDQHFEGRTPHACSAWLFSRYSPKWKPMETWWMDVVKQGRRGKSPPRLYSAGNIHQSCSRLLKDQETLSRDGFLV